MSEQIDHGCSCNRPSCTYDKTYGNPLRDTSQNTVVVKDLSMEGPIEGFKFETATIQIGQEEERLLMPRQSHPHLVVDDLTDEQIKGFLMMAGFHNAQSPYEATGTIAAFRRFIKLIMPRSSE